MTEVLFTTVARGVAALLGGHVEGTDHDRPWASTEPGLEGGLGVPALVLGMFTSALHAVSAAVLVITSLPETLSKLEELFIDMFSDSVGGGV